MCIFVTKWQRNFCGFYSPVVLIFQHIIYQALFYFIVIRSSKINVGSVKKIEKTVFASLHCSYCRMFLSFSVEVTNNGLHWAICSNSYYDLEIFAYIYKVLHCPQWCESVTSSTLPAIQSFFEHQIIVSLIQFPVFKPLQLWDHLSFHLYELWWAQQYTNIQCIFFMLQ